MKYKSIDAIIVEGNNSRELIQNLRSQAMFPEKTMTAYMEQVSANVKIDSQKIISTYSWDDFIKDLVSAEYLVLIEE
jgi:hypothetical protein